MKLIKKLLYLIPWSYSSNFIWNHKLPASEYHTTSLSLRDESFLSPGKGGLEDLLESRDFKGGTEGCQSSGDKEG